MEKGRGNHFRGKKLNEIKLDNDIYWSSESEDDEPIKTKVLNKVIKGKESFALEDNLENIPENINNIKFDLNDYSKQEAIVNEKKNNECISGNSPVRKKRKSKYKS